MANDESENIIFKYVINNKDNKDNNNIVLIKNIESIYQKFEWDCGVCCLCSIIKWLNIFKIENNNNNDNNKIDEIIIEFINNILKTESIWSIDLSNVFTELGIKHVYYTNTIGVKIDHLEFEFYKNNWESDKLRVNNLFLKTMNSNPSNLHLVSSSNQLPIKFYIDHISKGLPIILLVDSYYLYCNICKISFQDDNYHHHSTTCTSRCTISSNNNNNKKQTTDKDEIFCGHYIILVGYNFETKEIIYIDPSSNQRFCTISENNIDNARMKSGTDLDSIFILNQ